MSSIKHKLIAALLAMALLAGSLSVLAPSYPARALMPTAETISIPMVLFQGVLKAVEGGLYVILRKYVQQGIKNITKDTANYLFKGGKGKGPAYETKPWDNFWEEVGDEAVGAALEGFVQGAVNEYEAQKKKEEVYKSLEATKERTTQLSLEGGDLNYKLKACNQQSIGLADSNEITAKIKECDAIAEQLNKKGEEQEKFYKDNAGRLKAQGVREDYSNDLTRLRTDLETARADAKRTCDSNQGSGPTSENCRNKRQVVIDRAGDIDALNKKADAAFASHDPASSEAIKGIEKAQVEKDGKLVTGQTGALSEVGRTIVDIVCKPEADFALQIFLGLGDQISQVKRKPICPLDVLKKNWSRVITDSGFEPGGLLSEPTIDAWQNLASLVNPETSDLGVAWKISVAGHDVRDIARQLGVTDYGAIAAMGGYKGVANLANTAITSPAGAVGKAIDSTIESNFEGVTRFVPFGHIVADIIVTAGAAFLETTLDLVKDGLRKRQVVRKQPKGTNLSGLRPYVSSLYSPDADPNAGTEAYAEATLAVFDELKYTGEQSWDVLNRITATGESSLCYDPRPQASEEQKAADPESCAIDEDFNRAIREGMTVQQAMSAKPPLLNPDGIFGFNVTADNKIEGQPPISKNYPYNSLVILRKYRIIPVSWELAALYIKEKPDVCKGKNCTLGKLVAEFNNSASDFYQMIDPNWVLMVPPTKCMLEGYGPQIIQELEIPDQEHPEDKSKNTKQVVRAKTCVDYQTCLGQDATGKCERGYGYCLKEEFVVHFTGEICEPKYNSCRSFTDATTKQNLTVLTDSLADYKSGRCTAENAGCAWYSKERQYQKNDGKTAFVLDNTNREKVLTTDTKTQKAWSNATSSQVFFASTSSSLQKCEPQAEGCRQINGPAGTPPYLRLPPASLRCDINGVKDGSEVQWYKREECKKYTQLCKNEYVGCERYMPQNDDIAVTGKSPDDSAETANPRYKYRCPAACANIYAYAEQKTLFEALGNPPTTVARTVYFNVATAQKCSIADVGCEEFTNLDESRRGGEDKDYFTYLQRCVQEANPEGIPANEVFYHFVGSDTAGGQPEKHYVVGELIDHDANSSTPTEFAPKCADPAKDCDCSAADAKQSLYDPRIGTSPCREFINANGKPFYRYTNNLIYRTPDCTSYRRTIDNQDGIAHTYSPGLSRRCAASAVNCREYRAPEAGNVRVVSYDNFENQNVSGWHTDASSNLADARISNEGEIIGDHSLKAVKKKDWTQAVTFIQLAKRLPIQKDKTYHIRFHLKAPAGTKLFGPIISPVKKVSDNNVEVITLSEDKPILSGTWQQFQFIVTKDMMAPYELLDTSLFRIAVSKNNVSVDPEFYLDDVVIKEISSIEYVIRDSWVENREASCFNPTAPNATPPDLTPKWDSPKYPNCSLYTDRQGAQQAIRSFERICPNEMAGCVQATIPQPSTYPQYTFDNDTLEGWIALDPTTTAVSVDNKRLKITRPTSAPTNNSRQRITLPNIPLRNRSSYTIKYTISSDRDYNTRPFFWIDNKIEWATYQFHQDGPKGRAFTFTTPPIDLGGESQLWNLGLYVDATTATFPQKVIIDDVSVNETAYLIPDASKACQASDNKCTAYGVPKLLTKADGIGEQLKTSENKASDESRNEWKYKEEWNIAYLKVTPEEAVLAQNKFGDNDFTPYQSGICRAIDLGCRTYNPSGGGETYFRDPGKRVCQPPDASYPNWYYYTCETSTHIICGSDDDCPITNDIQEKCNINSKKVCPPYMINGSETNYDNVDSTVKASINRNRCSCDKDESNIDCKDAVVVQQTPGGANICYDRFKKEAVNYVVSVQIGPSFVKSCPFDANGCRKITDPNCKLQTDGNYTLINNYGRTPGAADSGIPCKPDYHFTEDFKTRTDECNSQVNPGAGCILFDDEKLQRFEYQINKGNDGAPLAIAQNPAPPNPTYCVCDRNTGIESDCSEKFEASASDPDTCYNRYYDTAATPKKDLLRTYEKVRVESRYDSCSLYKEAREKREAANITLTPAIPCNSDEQTAYGTALDANTLIKVRPDRQCKVWLECQSYEDTGTGRICKRRAPCNSGKPGEPCKEPLKLPTQYLERLLSDVLAVTVNKEARKHLLTLSGYARPDYMFSDGTQTKGGYDAYFDLWKQRATVADTSRAPTLTYQRIVPDTVATHKVCSNNLGKVCFVDTDCPLFNNFVGTCIANPGYLLACRLPPKSDSPSTVLQSQVVDVCRSETGSGGIYGYCLQPNPIFENEFGLSHPFEVTTVKSNAQDQVGKRVCSKSINTSCDGQPNDFCEKNSFGTCVYRYYENYCLNWFPMNRTGRENIFDSTNAKSDRIKIFYPDENTQRGNLYYCFKTKTEPKSITVTYTPADNVYSVSRRCVPNCGKNCSNDNYMLTVDGCFNYQNMKGDYYKNFREGILIAHTDKDVNNGYYTVYANDNEKINVNDIEKIEYNLGFAFKDFFAAQAVMKYAEYGGALDIPYPSYDKSTSFAAFFRTAHEEAGDDDPKVMEEFEKGSCTPTLGQNDYIKVQAHIINGKIDGWGWQVCRYQFTTTGDLYAALIFPTIYVKQKQSSKDIEYTYNETYCSEYVKVANNNFVVPARTKLTQGDLNGVITTVVPPYYPDDKKMALYKREEGTWDKCDEKEVKNAKQYAVTKDGVPIKTNINDKNSFSCTAPQLTLGTSDGYFQPCYGDTSNGGSAYCDKIGEDKPGGIKVLKQARDTDDDFEAVRNKTPFNKVYEYWRYTDDGAGRRLFKLQENSLFLPFWTETKRIGKQSDRRPRIFQYDNGGEANRFNAKVGADNSLTVSFYINAKDDQTPIKRYALYLPYGHNSHNSGQARKDGTGFKDSFVDSNSNTTTSNAGAGNKIKFGDFFEAYSRSDFTGATDPFANHKICIEVTDNWEACTRTCGTFGTGNESRKIVDWNNGVDCPETETEKSVD